MSQGTAQSFVPGRVVAGGDLRSLAEVSDREEFSVRFLRGPFEEQKGEPRSIALIEGGQPGRELELLVQAANVLSTPIKEGRAVVDLDYLMNYGGLSDLAYQLGAASRSFVEGFQRCPNGAGCTPVEKGPLKSSSGSRQGYQSSGGESRQIPATYGSAPFSREASRFVRSFSNSANQNEKVRPPIAVIDSGLDPTYCRSGRMDSIIDLSTGTPQMLDQSQSIDEVGHGTRVVRILDRATGDPRTRFILASLGAERNVTASSVAMAMTCCIDGIPGTQRRPAEKPLVVTMSLWPRVEGSSSLHQPLLVPFFAKTFPEVTFIMAAGNDGKPFEVSPNVSNLLYGAALTNSGEIPEYCSIPSDPLRTLATFGGCENTPFFDGSHPFGTSWATPLLAAAVHATLEQEQLHLDSQPSPYDDFRNYAIKRRFGMTPLGWVPYQHYAWFRRFHDRW